VGLFSRKPKSVALPFPAHWSRGDAVEPFHVRFGRDYLNDALIDESALWSRFADQLPPDEVRWMVGPVTMVFPDVSDLRAPGHLFCTDRRFIFECTLEGRPWYDYRTLEIPIVDIKVMSPSRFGQHIIMIGHGPDEPPAGVFFIRHMPHAEYLYAVMSRLVIEKAGLKNLGPVADTPERPA
jgi:hypothetical protein